MTKYCGSLSKMILFIEKIDKLLMYYAQVMNEVCTFIGTYFTASNNIATKKEFLFQSSCTHPRGALHLISS